MEDINRRLRAAEHDAAAARVLAGAADRDVTEIRAEIRDFRQATTASFNALREDFVDLREDFVDHGSGRFRAHHVRRPGSTRSRGGYLYWPQLVSLWPANREHYTRSGERAIFVLEPRR